MDSFNDEHDDFLTPPQPPNKRLKMTINSNLKSCKIYSDDKLLTPESKSTRKSFATLKNLGSTCYINCIIQVIRYTPGFCKSIQRLGNLIDHLKSLNIDMENEMKANNDVLFVQNLNDLFNEMYEREKFDAQKRPVYIPEKFVNIVWTLISFWSDGSQQDAHEFLQYLMSFVNECDLYLKKLQQQYKLSQIEKKEKEFNAQSELKCPADNQKLQNIILKPLKSLHTPTKGGASQSLSPVYNYKVPLANNNNKRHSINDELIFRPVVSKTTRSVTKRDKIRKSWIEIGKMELKECFVLLEKIDETQLVNGVLKLIKPQVPKEKLTQKINPSSSDVRKFKVRSRTFPCVPTSQVKIKEDLDEITQVVQDTTNEIQKPKIKTKRLIRCRTFSNVLNNDLISSRICKSPAELLRKYASIKGHVCEMDKLFKGTCLTITQCLSCETLKKSPEYFYDRSLPVNIDNECMDIDWIVEHLINESYLNNDSKYMCDTCACKQEAKIYTQYNEMPNILILHLLSYGLTSTNDGNLNAQKLSNRSKLASYFNCICEQCNLNEFKKHIFKLYAVVMHSGISLNSGHYTAYINYHILMKNTQISSYDTDDDIEWLHFDDSKVKHLSSIEFNRKIIESNYDSPYILFYIKENIVNNESNI